MIQEVHSCKFPQLYYYYNNILNKVISTVGNKPLHVILGSTLANPN